MIIKHLMNLFFLIVLVSLLYWTQPFSSLFPQLQRLFVIQARRRGVTSDPWSVNPGPRMHGADANLGPAHVPSLILEGGTLSAHGSPFPISAFTSSMAFNFLIQTEEILSPVCAPSPSPLTV